MFYHMTHSLLCWEKDDPTFLWAGSQVTEAVKQLCSGSGVDEIHPESLKALDVCGLQHCMDTGGVTFQVADLSGDPHF